VGHLQVLPTTFASVIVQTQFGKEAASLAGIDAKNFKDKIQPLAKKVDDLVRQKKFKEAKEVAKPLATLLRNTNINYIAAIAKLFQGLTAEKKRGR